MQATLNLCHISHTTQLTPVSTYCLDLEGIKLEANCQSVVSLQGVACTLQVERLQRKFATIHSTLAQQQNNKPGPDTPRMSSLAHMHAENVSKVCTCAEDVVAPAKRA